MEPVRRIDICRRDGDEIITTCITGEMRIVHEAGHGIMVVKELGRFHSHSNESKRWYPTAYRLCRLRPYGGHDRDGRYMMFNTKHLSDGYDLVVEELEDYRCEPGHGWRKALAAITADADRIAELTEALTPIANEDLRAAREHGDTMLVETKRGTVVLSYDGDTYELTACVTMGSPNREPETLAKGNAEVVRQALIEIYDVTVEEEEAS